jgi:ferredoxin
MLIWTRNGGSKVTIYGGKLNASNALGKLNGAAMSVCSVSCIGCGLCEKECKKDAIHVVNGVAVVDYDKCIGCKLCTKVCPRDAILPIATAEEKAKYKEIKKAQAEKAKAAAEAAAKAAAAETPAEQA